MAVQQRITDLVISRAGADTVVFDQRQNHLHTLPAEIAEVWESLDGDSTAESIARMTGRSCTEVEAAISQLGEAGVLEGRSVLATTVRDRRSLLRKAALGAAMVSVTAPMATHAQSAGQISCATSSVVLSHYYCLSVDWGTYDCVAVGCPPETQYIYNDASSLKDNAGTILHYAYRHRCTDIVGNPITTTPWLPIDPTSFPTCE